MALTPGQIVGSLAPLVGRAGAAGIAGNTMQESTDNPGDAGGGLAQWQGDRYQGLLNFARGHGLNPSSGAAALGYLEQDLKGPYSGLAAELRGTSDPGKAAQLFEQQYERAGIPMMGNRIKYAEQAFGAPGQGVPGGSAAGAGGFKLLPTAYTTHGFDTSAAEDAGLLKSLATTPKPFTGNNLSSSVGGPLGAIASELTNPAFQTTVTHNAPAPRIPGGGQAVGAVPQAGPQTGLQTQGASKLLAMVHSVLGGTYNQGNHDAVNQSAQAVKLHGTDCSGLISWLMGPHGLGLWSQSYATPAIPTAPGLQAGQGKSITIWNNAQPGNTGHVFIKIGNAYYASEGGTGIRQLPMSEVMTYLQHGSDGGHYEAFHPAGY